MEKGQKYKILVVDDDPQVRFFTEWILKDQYELFMASNGAEGEKIAFEVIPDLVVTDLVMPLKDGFELCQSLKNNATTSHIPLIILTARHDEDSVIKALSLSASAYIKKPFNPDVLKAQIQTLIVNNKTVYKTAINSKSSYKKLDKDDFIQQLESLIADNVFNSELSVDFLAKKMFMSRLTLLRKVQLYTDKDTKEILKDVKAKTAYHLITEKHMSVKEVSHKLGFKKIDTLYKIFKEKYGYTPGSVKLKKHELIKRLKSQED